MDDDQQPHVGPPDLILQAIVVPTDAPAEIRAAVTQALATRGAEGDLKHTWEDVTFAASAIALVEGTNQRAEPDTQWVFALSAESPRPGEQIHSSGSWASALHQSEFGASGGRLLWRVNVFDAVTTSPRPQPGSGAS
jgi:hypothetical protein